MFGFRDDGDPSRRWSHRLAKVVYALLVFAVLGFMWLLKDDIKPDANLSDVEIIGVATAAPASGFTVGQWSAYGTAHDLSLWQAASPPVAPYKTMANGVNVTAGQTIRDATLARGGSNALWGYGEGGTYDTDRERWIGTASSGHAGGGSNEVNEFVASTGNWVRQMDPTVELFSPQNVPWPSSIAYGGVHLEGPLALVDVNNRYPANVSPATGSKLNLYPNTSQTYGGITYMPSPYHKLWVCGGVSNWSPNFANSIIFEYDTVTKKWQAQDAEFGTFGGTAKGCSGFQGGATWDSTYNRILFNDWNSIYSYNPAAATGKRVTLIAGAFASVNDENRAIWDSKRKRLWLWGGTAPRSYDFSGGPTKPTVRTFNITGYSFPYLQGLGILYDPVRDIFVFSPFDGTRKLITVNPDTLVATDITPTSGATPPALANTGEHMYGRFFYVASQDIYVALVNASDSTSFVYKPAPFGAKP